MAKKTVQSTDYVKDAFLDKLNPNDSELYEHKDASSGVHGTTGEVVGNTDEQTLTNKTLTTKDNDLDGVSGNLVGDTDEQTLTNKTIDGDENTVKNISQLKDPTWSGEWQNSPDAGGHKLTNLSDPDNDQDALTYGRGKAMASGGGMSSTSNTETSIGTGSKTFTLNEDYRGYAAGTRIRIADSSNPVTNYMEGTVTSYDDSTDELVVDIANAEGSGTISDWSIGLDHGGNADTVDGYHLDQAVTSGSSPDFNPANILSFQYDEFTESGTFEKSEKAKWIYVEAVGGGGGGGNRTNDDAASGGGGGAFNCKWLLAENVSSSETVTVGSGGSGGADGSNDDGGDGGASSFGEHIVALGGEGGFQDQYGSRGGDPGSGTIKNGGYSGASGGHTDKNADFLPNGGASCVKGGAGGGPAGNAPPDGGTSQDGGDGGDGETGGSTKAGDGQAPGGAGGGSTNDGGGGDGGDGIVRVWQL